MLAAPSVVSAAESPANFGSFYTPLRYPGGKGRLGPWLASLMRHNGISGGWYMEPYAGGAGAALYLLMQGYVDRIIINDADPVIYAFWLAVTQEAERFAHMIETELVTIESRQRHQAVVLAPDQHDTLIVGFAAFFLNRTNRSGILRGGVIGGKAQDGTYKLDARFNRQDLADRVRRIGAMAHQITVLGLDALELLTDVGPGLPRKSLVYLDPPYYVKGSLLYRNHYQPADHSAIAACVHQAGYPVVVTYDDCPQVRELYAGMPGTTFSLHYSTHSGRPKTSEALFYRNLALPFDPAMTRSNYFNQHLRTKSPMLSQNVLMT